MKTSILKSFYYSGAQSVASLAKDLHKSIPSVTKIVNELVSVGLLDEYGLAPSTGGRRAARYILNTDKNPLFITLALDQYYSTAAIVNIRNEKIVDKKSIYNPLTSDQSLGQILALINEQLATSQIEKKKIAGMGISMPGFVITEKGTNDSYDSDSALHNIVAYFEKELSIPCYLENDSTAIAIAEQKFGKAKNTAHALVVNLSWGVGLGIIVDHKLFKGYSGFAGEFSHIPLSNLNKLCSCGKKGCLEVEASLLAAIDLVEESLAQGDNSVLKQAFEQSPHSKGNAFLSAVLKGDQLAISAANKTAYILGKGIATLIHILNPEKIIISGRGAQIGDIMLSQIQSAIHEFAIPKLSKQTEIEISEDPKNMQLLGSMCLLIENYKWK